MYKLFKLATEISSPLGLAGFALAVLFFLYLRILKNKKSPASTRRIINAVFILSLAAMICGMVGWIWSTIGKTSIEGVVYIKNGSNKDIATDVVVNVLELRKPGRTDSYGRFSIPVNGSEARKSYTFQLIYKTIRQFFTVNAVDSDLSHLEFTLDAVSDDPIASESDSTPNISVRYADLKQSLPTVPVALRLAGVPYYAEQAHFQLIISNNFTTSRPLHLRSVGVEAEPIVLSKLSLDSLDYKIDIDKLKGYGIVNVNEYLIDISKDQKITAKFLKSRAVAYNIDPANFFHSSDETKAYNLAGDSDAYLQMKVNLQLRAEGAFRIRFKIEYDTPDASKSGFSTWIYLVQKG